MLNILRRIFWLALPLCFFVLSFRSLYLFPTSDGLEVGLLGFLFIVPTTALLIMKAKDEFLKAVSSIPAPSLDGVVFSAFRAIGILLCLANLAGITVLKRGFTEYIAGGGLLIVEPPTFFIISPMAFVILFAFALGYLAFLVKHKSLMAGPLLYSIVAVTSVLWNPSSAQLS